MQVYYAVEIITIVIFHTCFVRCVISWLCQQATTYTNLPPGAAYGIAAIDTFAISIIPTYLLARFTVTIFSVNIIVYTLCVHFLAAMFATTPKPIIWIIMLYLYIDKVFLAIRLVDKRNERKPSISPRFMFLQASTETYIPDPGSCTTSVQFESSSTAHKKLPPSLELLLRHIP